MPPPPNPPPATTAYFFRGEITRFDVDSVAFFSPASTCLPLLAFWVISSLQLRRFLLSLSLAAASLTVAKLISPANGKPAFGRMWHLRCVERENKQIKHFISGLWQFLFVFRAVMKSLCFPHKLLLDLYSLRLLMPVQITPRPPSAWSHTLIMHWCSSLERGAGWSQVMISCVTILIMFTVVSSVTQVVMRVRWGGGDFSWPSGGGAQSNYTPQVVTGSGWRSGGVSSSGSCSELRLFLWR